MTKEMEKDIEKLYELLDIEIKEENITKTENINIKRTDNFFEKRWDSSFFSNVVRY